MITTIIFDLGGVYFTDGTKRAISLIAAQYNLTEAAVRAVLKGDLGKLYRTGGITAANFWAQAKTAWDISAPADELASIWLEGYVPIPGTVQLIQRLRVANTELLFLSDNVPERVEYLEVRYHFLHYFQNGVFSHKVHLSKPDPAIYQAVLALTKSSASSCVFIDDKPELLEPARALGIAGIAFQNPAQLEADLLALGSSIK